MTGRALDAQLVQRAVRLILGLANRGRLSEDQLVGILGTVGADAFAASAIRDGITKAGIEVVAPRPTPNRNQNQGSQPCQAEQAERQPRRVRPSATRFDFLDSARAAATALLEQDRATNGARHRTLTADEEVGLAFLMRSGNTGLDEELPKGFRRSLDTGDERARAFDSFFLHNVRLVASLAIKAPRELLEVEDVIQAGYFGLSRAIEMFNAELGLKFSTYATHWIRQAIDRAVANEGRLIRLPVHVWEEIQTIRRAQSRLVDSGRSAGMFELVAETGMPAKRIRERLQQYCGVLSLDKPIVNDAPMTLADLLLDGDPSGDPEASVVASDYRATLWAVVDELSDRERRVLRLRFGFDDGEPMTLDAIGAREGVTRERIRQIESKAVERLRKLLAKRGLTPILVPARSRQDLDAGGSTSSDARSQAAAVGRDAARAAGVLADSPPTMAEAISGVS